MNFKVAVRTGVVIMGCAASAGVGASYLDWLMKQTEEPRQSATAQAAAPAPARSCRGRAAIVEMPRSKYPRIVDHIEDSWDKGYPRVLRVNREGADERRERLLSWYERRHPQPKGDGKDLDEEPAAVLRSSWRASVRPIDESENRGAGAKLGAELRDVPNGTCVRYQFKG